MNNQIAQLKRSGRPPAAETRERPTQNTIVIENEALRRGFTLIPNGVLRDPGISFGARLTYTLLLSYAWQAGSCFPGQERMATDLGVTRQAVNKYLNELKEASYITWERRGLGKTNVYHILDRTRSSTPSVKPEVKAAQSAPPNGPDPDVSTRLHQDGSAAFRPHVNSRLHNKDAEEEDSEQQPVVAAKLKGLNVSSEKVQEILARYPVQHIQQKLNLLRWKRKHSLRRRPISDPAGWLVKAIENDYQPPPEFTFWNARLQRSHAQSQEIQGWDQEKQHEEERQQKEGEERYAKNIAALKSEYKSGETEAKQWRQALELIQKFTDDVTYRFWFSDTHLLAIRDNAIFIAVPNVLAKRRLENKYISTIARALSSVVDLKSDPKVMAVVPPGD